LLLLLLGEILHYALPLLTQQTMAPAELLLQSWLQLLIALQTLAILPLLLFR
jgi:hypothetical protein